MTAISWTTAVKRNAALEQCARIDADEARALWLATMGRGEPQPDSYAEAALDLAPVEYAQLLASGGPVNAYAVGCLFGLDPENQHMELSVSSFALAKSGTPHERREIAREAWERWKERAALADDISYGFGFNSGNSLCWETTRSFRKREERLDTIVRIAKMAGRIFAQLRGKKAQRVTATPEEIYSVELGNDLSRLLPSELIHLGQPTEITLLDRIANARCLQYAVRGSGEAGRGPLVICLDETGSMHGERGEWSKAAAIALARTAWLDKRSVSVVHWSTSVTITHMAPGNEQAMLDMVLHWFGGNNDAARALDAAADEVQRLGKAGDKGADVILVTDGREDIADAHRRALSRVAAVDARLWTVAVEMEIEADNPLRAQAVEYTRIGRRDVHEGGIGTMAGAVL